MTAQDLIQFRNRYGLTQEELGGILRISRHTVMRYESGSVAIPQGKAHLYQMVLNKLKTTYAGTETNEVSAGLSKNLYLYFLLLNYLIHRTYSDS